jgi:hypothetical protein
MMHDAWHIWHDRMDMVALNEAGEGENKKNASGARLSAKRAEKKRQISKSMRGPLPIPVRQERNANLVRLKGLDGAVEKTKNKKRKQGLEASRRPPYHVL